MSTLTLYHHPLSGHCHRVVLMLSLLGIKAKFSFVDVTQKQHLQSAFLELNRLGQIPVLTDGLRIIADSNAILVYLALRHDSERKWYPENPLHAAEIQRFLSIAAGPIAYGPAAARLVTVFGASLDHMDAITRSIHILSFMDAHLGSRQWLVADQATIADIANYSYIAHAPEGNVSLEPYKAVRSWLERIEALPGFVAMPESRAGLRI